MNGVHDMGGQQGMGPVVYEKNEPVFHASWEARITRSTVRCGHCASGTSTPTGMRLELMSPVDYLAHELLRAMALQARSAGCAVRPRDQRGDRERASRHRAQRRPVRRLPSRHLTAGSIVESLRADDPRRATVVQGEPARTRPQHQSHGPHSLATLRARQDRRHRPRSRCLSSFPIATPTFRVRNASTSTPYVSPHGSCGASKRVAARLGAPRPVGRLP